MNRSKVSPPDLPLATKRRGDVSTVSTKGLGKVDTRLNAEQKTRVIEGSLQQIGQGMELAQVLVTGYQRIAEIRATSKADVRRIEAETRQIETKAQSMVKVMIEQRGMVNARGQNAVLIIQEVTKQIQAISEGDAASRQAAINNLPRLLDLVLNSTRGGHGDADPDHS